METVKGWLAKWLALERKSPGISRRLIVYEPSGAWYYFDIYTGHFWTGFINFVNRVIGGPILVACPRCQSTQTWEPNPLLRRNRRVCCRGCGLEVVRFADYDLEQKA
ncbi:Uncharacterised protein [uncultured archaeon]|nr:Uncharacterised protein [uncultured archaeon]